ncbi:MAG TPA: hypothetical protein VMY59_08255 [Candidatus Thermoplasmatota archaeon]|nr:hypothetical protein [Candidatus Thermoplasmatota archaeon]
MSTNEEKTFYFSPNRIHGYIIIGALFIITLIFFNKQSVWIPFWPTIFGIGFCLYLAFDQWNECIKRKGKALVCDLQLDKGGHVCIHPYDMVQASRYDRDGKSVMAFTCLAGGGYLFAGVVGIPGTDFFLVVPPEHIIETETGMLVMTKLTKRKYTEFPFYIQSALQKLPRFNVTLAKAKDNIYFGITSKIDGTATAENFAIEEKFCMMNQQINDMKKTIDDYSSQQERLRRDQQPAQPIIIQQQPMSSRSE